ncbi:Fpg/Nei family DNA glycosylase [Luteipulveratus sp. YIM 133132]|uniref:DNA-formamidopyrimidine glycosylase family protein n=1 Tax=Luteipulveratus flavus TaxID=3031728 RepID=A0ABT6C423_9MICO|nr:MULTISPECIES: DNA-formamidopyrimidine glycosylase family protein [unclassified Luteipulveratus]MDE9366569.1 Fpg/Nei family DNA glycosylase [Luteipulveratus sp. YIM 133132]MDF8263520.1 DNA-formamidopyrimidine glycosylase family protein [Luteipulveratus sp. YIM 133296]
MPELPEVQALADFLRGRVVDLAVAGVELGSFSVLKTYDPAPQAFSGLMVTDVRRYGKFVDLDVDGLHLVFHLARAGWLRWSESMPATVLRPGKSPIALRVRFSDGSGFDLTEAGTKKGLAAYVVRDPQEVPGIATLGPDPLADDFDEAAFAALVNGRRTQIKGLLRDQSVIAGVGNAYSDEALHAAKLSPFAMAASLSDEEVSRLYAALREVLTSAVAASSGKPAKDLKDAKRSGMRVHGRTGEACPVCGDVIREVSFADRSLQYCPTCQTGGKPLADRRMSRLLK